MKVFIIAAAVVRLGLTTVYHRQYSDLMEEARNRGRALGRRIAESVTGNGTAGYRLVGSNQSNG
jgi:hypothetical protein